MRGKKLASGCQDGFSRMGFTSLKIVEFSFEYSPVPVFLLSVELDKAQSYVAAVGNCTVASLEMKQLEIMQSMLGEYEQYNQKEGTT